LCRFCRIERQRETPMLLRVELVGTAAVLTMMDNKLDATNQDDFLAEIKPGYEEILSK